MIKVDGTPHQISLLVPVLTDLAALYAIYLEIFYSKDATSVLIMLPYTENSDVASLIGDAIRIYADVEYVTYSYV